MNFCLLKLKTKKRKEKEKLQFPALRSNHMKQSNCLHNTKKGREMPKSPVDFSTQLCMQQVSYPDNSLITLLDHLPQPQKLGTETQTGKKKKKKTKWHSIITEHAL